MAELAQLAVTASLLERPGAGNEGIASWPVTAVAVGRSATAS